MKCNNCQDFIFLVKEQFFYSLILSLNAFLIKNLANGQKKNF